MSENEVETEVDVQPEIGNVDAFVNALRSDDMVAAQDAFNAEMSNRISDALDAAKIDVAQSMYGAADEVSTDVEPEEMEIDAEFDEAEEEV